MLNGRPKSDFPATGTGLCVEAPELFNWPVPEYIPRYFSIYVSNLRKLKPPYQCIHLCRHSVKNDEEIMTSARANRVKGKVIFSIRPQFSVAPKGFLPGERSSPHLELPVPILTQPSLAFLTPQPSSAATSWNSTQPSFIGTNSIHHLAALIATTSSNPLIPNQL